LGKSQLPLGVVQTEARIERNHYTLGSGLFVLSSVVSMIRERKKEEKGVTFNESG
jgi:hypothetical protein